MRTSGREAMRRLVCAVAAVAVLAALAGACTNTPDTTLHPDPPAVTYAPLQHPFRGARLFVDDQTAGARWQRASRRRLAGPDHHPAAGALAERPAGPGRTPGTRRPARQSAAPCSCWSPTTSPTAAAAPPARAPPPAGDYRRWIDRLIHLLGSTRAAVVVEPDAVAADCFDTRRAILLKHSVKRLANAGQYVYLDAGHARWRSTGEMAERLLSAGIQHAQGFSVNVANRQTTRQSVRWGRELSDLLGRPRVRRRHLPQRPRPSPGRAGPGRRVVQPATPGTRPGPHDQDQHARAGRAALDQAPRRIGRHLRRRDDLPLLPDPGTTLDGQQPVRGGRGSAACGGRRRFGNHGRTRAVQP